MQNGDLSNIYDEVEEVFQYARRYFSVNDEYHKVWYKLCVVLDATKWPNIPLLSELQFSLPFPNGHVECIFSQLMSSRQTEVVQ